MEKKTLHLPEELIIQILLRLPVKSVVRFKCVCKSWLSLISDPYFATSHFEATAAHTQRIMFITTRSPQARSIDFEASLNDDAAIVSLKLDPLFSQSSLNLKIGGSCRGILFLHCNEGLYLWNPSTGIHKQIPLSPIMSSNVDSSIFTNLYGFGYDPSTDDYLVALGSSDAMLNYSITHFELFSSRGNTWKEIESNDFPHANVFHDFIAGTLLNGVIHWMAYFGADVVVAFDLKERKFNSLIPLPDDFDIYYCLTMSVLWICGGLLSLWAVENVPDSVDIWVMKDREGHSSWAKTFVLSIHDYGFFFPICSTNCGDIVGYDSTGLEKYNDGGQLLEHRSYCKIRRVSQVALYTESLLPLPFLEDTLHA